MQLTKPDLMNSSKGGLITLRDQTYSYLKSELQKLIIEASRKIRKKDLDKKVSNNILKSLKIGILCIKLQLIDTWNINTQPLLIERVEEYGPGLIQIFLADNDYLIIADEIKEIIEESLDENNEQFYLQN